MFEDPFAAEDRAGALWVGGDGEDAAHGGDAAAFVVCEGDFAEFFALDVGDVVVGGEGLVEVGVVAVEEVEDVAVVEEDVAAVEEDFVVEGLADFAVEAWEFAVVWGGFVVDVFEAEPLAGEVFDEGVGVGVVEEAFGLVGEGGGVVEAFLCGEAEEFVVWGGGPEEVGEAGGDFEVVELSGLVIFGWLLFEEEEFGGDEDGFEHGAHGVVPVGAAFEGGA